MLMIFSWFVKLLAGCLRVSRSIMPAQGDRLNLDEVLAGQARGLHGGSGRRLVKGEILRVDVVEFCEVIHVGKKDGDVDEIPQRAASRLKNRLHVPDNGPRLRLYVVSGDVALLVDRHPLFLPGLPVARPLPGQEEQVACAHGVRISTERLRGFLLHMDSCSAGALAHTSLLPGG